MTFGETPFCSITSDRSGNISPSAKPKTVIAAMAAKRFIQRCLSMSETTPDESAAGDSEADEQKHIDHANGERDRFDAKGICRRACNGRAQQAANAPHRGESRASGDEIGALEIVAQNCEPDRVDREGASADGK